MKDSLRFSAPIDIARPRGARLLESYSPKLARRVQLFDHANFMQWVRLDADPSVMAFCERPARLGADGPVISFWVQRLNAQEFVLLSHDGAVNLPHDHDGTPLRIIAPPELAAAEVWISNWQRMLPVINCTRALVPEPLKKAVLKFVGAPTALSRIESEFSAGDPMLARGAVFELLRTGALAAPSLHTDHLCLHSTIEPIQ